MESVAYMYISRKGPKWDGGLLTQSWKVIGWTQSEAHCLDLSLSILKIRDLVNLCIVQVTLHIIVIMKH